MITNKTPYVLIIKRYRYVTKRINQNGMAWRAPNYFTFRALYKKDMDIFKLIGLTKTDAWYPPVNAPWSVWIEDSISLRAMQKRYRTVSTYNILALNDEDGFEIEKELFVNAL